MFEMAILVPETLCQQATNAILALNQAHPLPDTLSAMVQSALQRGAERFVDAYLDEDEDLVEAMAQDGQLFANQEVQEAFLARLQNPLADLADDLVIQPFATIFPRRRNRKRVNRAVTVLLHYLVKEIWHLPDLTALVEELLSTSNIKIPPITPSHNLPQPDYERFVGRKKELALLLKLLSPENRHFVITVDGIGGIGKSALALEIAYRYVHHAASLPVSERFEAIIWVTAKQSLLTSQGIIAHPQTLRTLDDIYSTMASTFEREAITRARRSEQDEIVHSILRQQRTLLIIDNLESVDDGRVMSFIRDLPTPTKAIITTRHRVDVAYPIRLVGMSHSEALELIADESQLKQITLTDEQATRLYKRTGGVPLAIVWSVAQMSVSHNIEATLTHLGQPTSDIAHFCFDAALHLIRHKPAHKLLMALSLFATDASRDALGYVTELPILDRDEGLEELEKLSLLNKEEGRFSLLPLTRVYSEMALQQMALQQRFRERWVAHYVAFLREQQPKWHDTLLHFAIEENNIINTMDWCWEVENYHEFITILKGMSFYLRITGKWDIWAKYLSLFIDLPHHYNPGLSDHLELSINLAWITFFQHDLDRTHLILQEVIPSCRYYKHYRQLNLALWLLAFAQFRSQENGSAKKTLDEVTNLAHFIGNDWYRARSQRLMAEIELSEGLYDSAEIRLIEAQEILEEMTPDSPGLAYNYRLRGKVSLMKGNYELSRQYLMTSLDITKKLNVKLEMAGAKRGLAELEFALGHYGKAKQLANEALSIFIRLGAKRLISVTGFLLNQIAVQSESRNVARSLLGVA